MAKKKTSVVKKTAKNAPAKKSQDRDVLVVASKLKAYIKSKNMMTASDSIVEFSEKLYCLADKAIARAQANRRSTVKPQDL